MFLILKITGCVERTKGKKKLSLVTFTTGIDDNNIYQLHKKKEYTRKKKNKKNKRDKN
jgi:hypothetical protein